MEKTRTPRFRVSFPLKSLQAALLGVLSALVVLFMVFDWNWFRKPLEHYMSHAEIGLWNCATRFCVDPSPSMAGISWPVGPGKTGQIRSIFPKTLEEASHHDYRIQSRV